MPDGSVSMVTDLPSTVAARVLTSGAGAADAEPGPGEEEGSARDDGRHETDDEATHGGLLLSSPAPLCCIEWVATRVANPSAALIRLWLRGPTWRFSGRHGGM